MQRACATCHAIAVLCGSVVSYAATAGAITVAPTRIELNARRPIATLEVSNEGSDKVTVQLERVAWSQSGGIDQYTPSSALIATPSVFELAPHATQTLRIALRDAHSATIEQAFRVYASEVPSSLPLDGSGLKMALRIGIPVFVETTDSAPHLVAEVLHDSGRKNLRLRNAGGHFTRALAVELANPAGAVVWQTKNAAYLLAGGEHEWPLDAVTGPLNDGDRLRVSVTTETGVEHVDARLSP